MNSTTSRIKTFESVKWCMDSKNTRRINTFKRKLAESGFYATPSSNRKDCTTCFACKIELHDWNLSMDPLERHVQENESCYFASIQTQAKLKNWNEKSVKDRLASFPDNWNTICPVSAIDVRIFFFK